MIIAASGIACGRVHTTVTTWTIMTESRKITTILQIIGWQTLQCIQGCALDFLVRNPQTPWKFFVDHSLSTSLILDIHVAGNWHLTKEGICWPVSPGHITGSCLELIKIILFWSWPLAMCWFLIRVLAHLTLPAEFLNNVLFFSFMPSLWSVWNNSVSVDFYWLNYLNLLPEFFLDYVTSLILCNVQLSNWIHCAKHMQWFYNDGFHP